MKLSELSTFITIPSKSDQACIDQVKAFLKENNNNVALLNQNALMPGENKLSLLAVACMFERPALAEYLMSQQATFIVNGDMKEMILLKAFFKKNDPDIQRIRERFQQEAIDRIINTTLDPQVLEKVVNYLIGAELEKKNPDKSKLFFMINRPRFNIRNHFVYS